MQLYQPGEAVGIGQAQVEQDGVGRLPLGDDALGFLHGVSDPRFGLALDHAHLIGSGARD